MVEQRHLLALQSLPAQRLRAVLALADRAAHRLDQHTLAGRTVATLFFENTTRTRSSFTLAAQRLGAHVVDCSGPDTSVAKGESVIDTLRTVAAMGVDAVVIRAAQAGLPALAARDLAGHGFDTVIINAGDGRHEHPTQGLVDALALARAAGRATTSPTNIQADHPANAQAPFDLTGLTVGLLGDLANSRVFRSDVAAFTALGAQVVAIGPPTLAPPVLARLGCRVSHDLDAELPRLDALQVLRLQMERAAGKALASLRDYRAGYALTTERAARMKPGAFVMHPGPMNRGVEIDHDVAEQPRHAGAPLPTPLILQQVAAGVDVRAAVLADLILRQADDPLDLQTHKEPLAPAGAPA